MEISALMRPPLTTCKRQKVKGTKVNGSKSNGWTQLHSSHCFSLLTWNACQSDTQPTNVNLIGNLSPVKAALLIITTAKPQCLYIHLRSWFSRMFRDKRFSGLNLKHFLIQGDLESENGIIKQMTHQFVSCAKFSLEKKQVRDDQVNNGSWRER